MRILLILTLLILVSSVHAASAPILPDFFYGKAQINGRDIPVDSYVIARIDYQIKGAVKITEQGIYGSYNTDKKLPVAGDREEIGDTIEFYLKIAGLEEIKASNTAQLQSSTINELDLTFNGPEIEIEEPSSDISTTFGSNTPIPGLDPFFSSSYYYDVIEAERQIDININDPTLPLTQIQLILFRTLYDIDFNFEIVDSLSALDLADIYKYVSIESPNLLESDVKTAIIKFKIENEWFTKNNYDPDSISLLRYSGKKWLKLPTEFEGSDRRNHYYRAGTNGFSIFAIKAERSSVDIVEVVYEPETEEENSENTLNKITGFVAQNIQAPSNAFLVMLIIYLITISGFAVFTYLDRRYKE